LGVPLVSGRDFTDADRSGTERVVIVSATLAQRLFPGQDPINRHLLWTDSVMRFIGVSTDPRRIVGVAADVNDETIEPALAKIVGSYVQDVQLPGALPLVSAAAVLLLAAVVASVLPAARAARVDVMQALRSE